MEKISFGSFYVDGKPVAAEYQVKPMAMPTLKLGDTTPGLEIQWIYNGVMYVADRCVCLNVSWDDLVLVRRGPLDLNGRILQIDGVPYRSWLLTARADFKNRAPFTWPEILEQSKELGDPVDVWHSDETFFWGQYNVSSNKPEIWGLSGLDVRRRVPHDSRRTDLGYRPALEKLSVLHLTSDLKGAKLCVYCKDGRRLTGTYVDSNDYDLVVKTGFGAELDSWWASVNSDIATINRDMITWVNPAENENK